MELVGMAVSPSGQFLRCLSLEKWPKESPFFIHKTCYLSVPETGRREARTHDCSLQKRLERKYFKFFKNWNIADLQCCVSFRYTAKWFSFMCVYIYIYIYTHIYIYTYIYIFSSFQILRLFIFVLKNRCMFSFSWYWMHVAQHACFSILFYPSGDFQPLITKLVT